MPVVTSAHERGRLFSFLPRRGGADGCWALLPFALSLPLLHSLIRLAVIKILPIQSDGIGLYFWQDTLDPSLSTLNILSRLTPSPLSLSPVLCPGRGEPQGPPSCSRRSLFSPGAESPACHLQPLLLRAWLKWYLRVVSVVSFPVYKSSLPAALL